jgi:hypothetical protein
MVYFIFIVDIQISNSSTSKAFMKNLKILENRSNRKAGGLVVVVLGIEAARIEGHPISAAAAVLRRRPIVAAAALIAEAAVVVA